MTFAQWIDSEPVPGWLLALIAVSTPGRPSPWSVRLRAIGWSWLLFGGWTVLAVLLIFSLGRFFAFWLVTVPLALLWLAWRGGRDLVRAHGRHAHAQ
jgi:hypothetical protein